jgi:hypothetical protein
VVYTGIIGDPKRRTNFTGLTPIIVYPFSTGNTPTVTVDGYTWESRSGPSGASTNQVAAASVPPPTSNGAGKASFYASARFAYFKITYLGNGELVDVVVHSNPAGVD